MAGIFFSTVKTAGYRSHKKYVSVCLQTKWLWVRVQLLLASSFINLNDRNITSKDLLANTFVKTNPAKKHLLTRS